MIARSAALALLLSGCLLNRELYERRLDELTDDDGDGFHEDAGDCDDENPLVSPGAAERCDGFDNNCDGSIDEVDPSNDTLWGADADGDGFAPEGATPTPSCASPGAGWVSAWGDCDDRRAEVYPGAPELCDGLDDDCDGARDEEPTTDPLTWYQDDDGDGYGAAASATLQCLAPADDWVEVAGDCDDTTVDVGPDAGERCNGEDDDCDGVVDDPPVLDAAGWYADTDGDGYGDDRAGSCVAADGYVSVGGDCDDGDGAVHPDAEEVCNDRVDNDCDGGPGDCTWEADIYLPDEITIGHAFEDESVGYTGGAADLDGDGDQELLVGTWLGWSEATAEWAGSVTVFESPITASTDVSAAAWTWWGSCDYCGLSSSLLTHDVDGDGLEDVQIGEPNREVAGESGSGSLYTFLGPLSASDAGLAYEHSDATISGGVEGDSVGERSYVFGDIDGDGLSDYGTGFEWYSYGDHFQNGLVRVFTSVPVGEASADDLAIATIVGTEDQDWLGLTGTGVDLDGDGLSEVIVGAPNYDSGAADGAALVYYQPSGLLTADDADVVLYSEGYNQNGGQSVDRAGDVNDDGRDDLLVGAPQSGDGAAYLVWGSATLDTRSLGDAEVTFRASEANALTGYVVKGLGDLDEDGHEDVFLSDGGNENGDAYVFFGPFDAPGTLRTADADVHLSGDRQDVVYTTAFTPGDATGDDVPDLVVGSYKNGNGYLDGAVFIVDGIGM